MILTCSDAAFFFIAKHDASPKKNIKTKSEYIRKDIIC